MANSVDTDQTAPIGAVCSGSTLFASILTFVSNVRQLFTADDFSRRHFQLHFFLGALNVNSHNITQFKDSAVLTSRDCAILPSMSLKNMTSKGLLVCRGNSANSFH